MSENESKSIIADKYGKGYTGANDWLAGFIDGQVKEAVTREKTVTDDEGNKTTETVELKRKTLNVDKLFDLAAANGIDARAAYGDQLDRPNAAGRLRMTIGNKLRSAAKHRHGLYDIDGDWAEAPVEFIGDHAKTQNPDGSKIQAEETEAA